MAACLVSLLSLSGGCASVAPAAPAPRPASWAVRVSGEPGLPSLHRVSATLYRSAQPTGEGFARLGSHTGLVPDDAPIETVLSLRGFHDDDEFVTGPGLRLERIRFHTWHPEDEDVVKFLRIVTTPACQPVLVHCRHGADRTGAMVAIYRVACEGWTKSQAIDEMIHGDFGFHPMWQNLLTYIEALDIDAIKAEVAERGPWPVTPAP